MSNLTMRLLRVAVLLVLLGGMSAAGVGRVAAQELDGNVYTDDEYGWSVEFDDEFFTGEEVDERTYRGLNLSFEQGFGTLAVYDNGETDPAACLDSTVEDFEGSETFLDFEAARTIDAPESSRDAEGSVFTTAFNGEDGEIPLVFYIECREVDGGTLNVQLASVEDAYEDSLPAFEGLLGAIETGGGSSQDDETPEPEDEETPDPDDEETPDPDDEETPEADDSGTRTGGSGLEGNVYADQAAGWSVEFDDRVWEAEEAQSDPDADLAYRGVRLSGEGLFASLVVYQDGITDAADCLADLQRVYESSDGWEDLAPARRLELPETDPDAETALYTGTLLLDDGDVDAALYLECREVEDATLSIIVTIAEDEYEGVLPDVEALLVGVETGGGTAADEETPEADDEETPEADDEETPEPDAPDAAENDVDAGELDDGTFTDTALGYSVTFDDRIWTGELLEDAATAGVFLTTDDEELFATVTIDASVGYDGIDVEQCVEDLAAGYEEFDGYSSLREERNADGPETPRDAASAVYSFTFTYEDESEAELVAYIECRPIDGDTMIRTTIQTTEDSLAANVDVFQELLDGIEIDGGRSAGDEETPESDDPAEEDDNLGPDNEDEEQA